MDFVLTHENKLFSSTYIFYLWSKSQHGLVSRKFLTFNNSKGFSYKHVPYKEACIIREN